ncbi:MAG: LysM peptidoglycan-binding domain-containing protein [Candidatus Cloacimonadota bacterium]|nr:LysM peptidoglycan-binding domain-containing protein [Candidatus Cloacimonadota bacterium]
MIHSKSLIKFVLIFSLLGLSGFSPSPKYITKSEKYHIVKKGDTLYSIGKKYGLSIEALKRINNLTSDKILVGQKIYIVEKKSSQQYYVTQREIPKSGYHLVKKGETLYRISKMYGLSLEELMEFNQLSSYTIMAGEKIWLKSIPSKTVVIQKKSKSKTIKQKPVSTSKPKLHIVKKGENLYRIALRYNLSIYELKQYNNLSSTKIFVGQKLLLEPKKGSLEKYTKIRPKIPSKYLKRYGLIWPCNGKITSPFGMRDGKPHKGLDISAPVGTPIKSVLDGEVAYTGWQRGYGNVIILKHDHSLMTVYAHNDENFVEKGDNVEKGEKIATIGLTGNTTGSHVHFEVRLDGRAMDPEKFLP